MFDVLFLKAGTPSLIKFSSQDKELAREAVVGEEVGAATATRQAI